MEHGTVTSAWYENGVVLCNVQPVRISNEYEKVPVVTTHAGLTTVPRQGQKVAMDTLEDGTRIIVGVIAKQGENSRPSDLSEDDFTIQVDPDTEISLVENANGDYDLTLSASGSLTINATGDVTVNSNGAVDVTGGGDVTVDAGGKALISSANGVEIDGIPFTDHTHTFEDSTINDTGDGSGSESTTTKETQPPSSP